MDKKYNCKCCGAATDASCYGEPTCEQMAQRQYCFECNLWWKFVNDEKPEEHYHSVHSAFVINGQVFTDGGRIEQGYNGMVGHAGREFAIKTFDGKIVKTNNLWAGGAVPERWRGQIKDNAEFVA